MKYARILEPDPWDIGATWTMPSRRVAPNSSSSIAVIEAMRAACDVVAPLGRPVVPEVCRIMLGSSGSIRTSGRAGLAAPSSSA